METSALLPKLVYNRTVYYVKFDLFVNTTEVSLEKLEWTFNNLLLLYALLDFRKVVNMTSKQFDIFEEFSEIYNPAIWETFRNFYSLPVLIINFFLRFSRKLTVSPYQQWIICRVLDFRKVLNMTNKQFYKLEEFLEIYYPAICETFRNSYPLPVSIIKFFLGFSRKLTV